MQKVNFTCLILYSFVLVKFVPLGVLLKAHYITSLDLDRNPAQHSIIKGLRLSMLLV